MKYASMRLSPIFGRIWDDNIIDYHSVAWSWSWSIYLDTNRIMVFWVNATGYIEQFGQIEGTPATPVKS